MSTIPTLTTQSIRTFVGEQHFQTGQQLAHDGAILHPEQQAMALKAYCKIRSLCEKLGETEQWTTYIAWVRKQHSRLSTLKAELISANVEGETK